MKRSQKFGSWLRTRNFTDLWWSTPALLAFVLWALVGLALFRWRPDEIRVRYAVLAEHALDARDFETARIASQRLLALGVEPRSKWLFNLALAQAGLGHDREASGLFAAVAPLDKPGYLPAHVFLAQALLLKTNPVPQDIQTAETHLVHALSLDPSFLGANELLAQVYIRSGQWELACERLREIVAIRPETSLLLAAVLKAKGDSLGARSWAERAARFHREKLESAKLDLPLNRLGWVEALLMLDDFPTAFSVLEKGWQQSEDKAYPGKIGEVCAVWADSLVKTRPAALESRMRVIQQGLQYAPQNETLLRHLVRVSQLDSPEAEAARETLAKTLAEGKSTAVIHFAFGLDAWQRGQPELARKHFTLSFESAPQMPDVANNMAMILAVGSNPDLPRALGIIQSVLEKIPDNANYRETRGQILVRLARWPEAVIDLEYALPQLGGRRAIHAALAEAYTKLGSHDLADQHLRLAKSLAQSTR